MKYKTLRLENLGGNFLALKNSLDAGKKAIAFGLSAGAKAHVSMGLSRFVLYIAEDIVSARTVADGLSAFTDGEVAVLPARGDLLILNGANSLNIVKERVTALEKIINGKASAVVVTADSLLQYLPKKEMLERSIFTVSKGQVISIEELTLKLINAGYVRGETTESRGEFSLRGDIMSVFPISENLPYRIHFFGDEIENIRQFEPATLVSVSDTDSLSLVSASDILLPRGLEKDFDKIIKNSYKFLSSGAEERLKSVSAEMLNLLENSPCSHTLAWVTPYFTEHFSTILDYLPENSAVIFDNPAIIADKMRIYTNEHCARVKTLSASGDVTRAHEKSLVAFKELTDGLFKFGTLAYESITGANELFLPDAAFKFKSKAISSYYLNYNLLASDIKGFLRAGKSVLLCLGDMRSALAFKESLEKEDIAVRVATDLEPDFCIQSSGGTVFALPWDIAHGFNYSETGLVVIGRSELVRGRSTYTGGRKRKRAVFVTPKEGDFVVHEIHGIGRCVGIERIVLSHGEKDFVAVDYAGGDRLYVPVEQMDRLTKYSGGDEPHLSKIGGAEFQRQKDKVRQSVKKMAFDLLELYGKRKKSRGFRYSQDNELQTMFESAFPYSETPDQLEAVGEIKADMEEGIVMDRLLCGDVGYGKTEVAFRAVYKTVMDGKQAAILAPTTILARQHYNTALARFNEFGVKIALMSRFQSDAENKKTLEDLKVGKVDFIIATHRLLSKDVAFKDLGLLVLDEEQRFGVEHKEKLKLFKNNVNVLTLSATPIPRTLNMALSGIRDISVLETPPENRLPVQTYVTELSDGLLSDAIRRELARGGQVFILYNRVQTIDSFAAHVAGLVPEASVLVGHGQQTDSELESAITAFYNKDGNVLVCTTIIENGIDLPDANTLIVCDADRLGLSALYQLRGRVGRGDKVAYAYFTTKDRKALTEDATKRLNAILDYTELGSGFNIAMRDLEIRGAGNVLGREQHGHIAKVGYDMYVKLLEETISEMSGETKIKPTSPEIISDCDAFIPDYYIESNNNKISAYKRIAEIESAGDLEREVARLTDAYGALPQPVLQLLDISLIKSMAGRCGAEKVLLNSLGTSIIFSSAEVFKNNALTAALSEYADRATLSVAGKPQILFKSKNLTDTEKLALLKDFLILVTQEI